MKKTSKIDFLAIGDIVIDAFIKLKDAHVHCKIDTNACELCVRFGDKVPYEEVIILPAVGNSPNAAVSASRLGLNSALVAYVGDDDNGKLCLDTLTHNGVENNFVSICKDMKTNYHYVLLYGSERTILVKHEEYPYALPKNLLEIGWIYLSSLASNSLSLHMEIAEFLKNHPETKLAFQPGTFQMKLGIEKLRGIYERTEIFFCNKEEAQLILTTKDDNIKNLLKGICAFGPKISVITDGPDGAYAYDGINGWFIPMYPDIAPPVDRTGAGDAFSSTFTIAIASGKTIPEALSWGPINSMSVVQYTGAQQGLLTREKLEKYLTKSPESYKIKKL